MAFNRESIVASGGHLTTTFAEAGAAGDLALVPAVALTISNVSRTARIATGTGGGVTSDGASKSTPLKDG